MKNLAKKLRSKKGFTITEMLVTVAVLSLLTVAISTAMTGSMATYKTSVEHSESSVLTSTLTQALNDELRYARDITIGGGTDLGPLDTYTSSVYGANSKIAVDPDSGQVEINGVSILGSGAYTGLKVSLDIDYNKTAKLFEVKLSTIDAAKNEIKTTEFSISPINQ